MDKTTVQIQRTVVALRGNKSDDEIEAESLHLASQGVRYLVFDSSETMELWRCRLAALA